MVFTLFQCFSLQCHHSSNLLFRLFTRLASGWSHGDACTDVFTLQRHTDAAHAPPASNYSTLSPIITPITYCYPRAPKNKIPTYCRGSDVYGVRCRGLVGCSSVGCVATRFQLLCRECRHSNASASYSLTGGSVLVMFRGRLPCWRRGRRGGWSEERRGVALTWYPDTPDGLWHRVPWESLLGNCLDRGRRFQRILGRWLEEASR